MAHACPSKDTCPNSSLDCQDPFQLFHNNAFGNYYICLQKFSVRHHFDSTSTYHHECHRLLTYGLRIFSMECHSSSLQFWTVDLEAHVLSSAIEQVYNTFFYSTLTHLLHQQSDEVLFGCFVTRLNAAFESKLTLEDEGYESVSENFNIPTPLRRTSRIHHVSSDENISFDPATPCTTCTSQSHHKLVWHRLTFSSSDDDDTSKVDNPLPSSIVPLQNPVDFLQQPYTKCTLTICDDLDDDKEDFQTVSLEDDHWTMEEILDRHLCINEHSVLH